MASNNGAPAEAEGEQATKPEEELRAELARLQAAELEDAAAEERLLEKLQATIELEISMAVRLNI